LAKSAAVTTAPDITTPSGIARRRPLVMAVFVIAAMTVLRIVYASAIELRTDEAYYWTWSKETALSFLDHPPMIAWFIRLGTAIFGDTTLGVRFGGIVAMLVTQLLLADIVRRLTHDARAVMFAVLMPEAALYYGLLMAKVAPDVAMIPFAVAMMWSLVRLAQSGDGRWWLAAGLFAGLSMLSKFTAIMFAPAVAAFLLVPDWRGRWLRSPYPYLAVLVAIAVFSPVLIWNAQHDWASFRFQGVRATANYGISWRTVGDYIGLQFGLVGFVMLPVVLTGLVMTAWRGYRTREPVAILLSTAVLVPFAYFFAKSLTLRVGDTWPMFMWPVGFAAAAVNLVMLSRENRSARLIRSSLFWLKAAIASGIAFVVIVFLYYVAAPWNLLGKIDPIGAEAGYEQVAARVQTALDETGATWIAATDYRTYAMMRWLFRGRVPVIEINERGRFQDFRDPGIDRIKGHAGIYVGREPDNRSSLWENIPAKREQLGQVERRWRGVLTDTYVIEKLTGWTPELSPPEDSPLFWWRVLALLSFSPQTGRNEIATPRPLSSATNPSPDPTVLVAAAPRTAVGV
jgi:4-amino-4-deoxy-L-arabinose transferase-like glycosyltransferase